MTDLFQGRDHEWIEVGRRRWCVGCPAFQTSGEGRWSPGVGTLCPRSTPYAEERDRPEVG
jgi:hypothetical protein